MRRPFARAWAAWKAVALKIGAFNTRLILSVLYYSAVLPFGAAIRLFGDPWGAKARPQGTGWVPRETRDRTLEDLRRQF